MTLPLFGAAVFSVGMTIIMLHSWFAVDDAVHRGDPPAAWLAGCAAPPITLVWLFSLLVIAGVGR